MAEEFDSGRLAVTVVAEYDEFDRDMRRVEQAARATGTASEQAFRGADREAEAFRQRVKGTAETLLGLAAILGGKLTGGMRGFVGLLGRSTSAVINFTGLGLLTASKGLHELAESTRDANGELSAIGKAADVGSAGLNRLAKVALTVSGIITGVQITAAAAVAALVVKSSQAASEFAPAWNRVRTILGDSEADFDSLRSQVSALAAELGVEGTQAADTFYQILSAMPQLAGEPTRALDILRVALEGGSTGFTEAAQSAEAVTAILNAFSLEAEDARRVSDALFAAQDQGVLTFGEVASSIGTVADLTAALGGQFEDLLGIVATVTPAGVSVSETFTQVRGVLNSVLKPTEEAKRAAKELGVDFSAAALETKGLNGFLLDLIETTDGKSDQMARFFGSQEALALVVSLARQTDVLREKTEKVGAAAGTTAGKVDTMNDSWERQREILDEQLAGALRDIGFGFDDVAAKGLRAVNTIIGAMRHLAALDPTPREIIDAFQGVGRRTPARLGPVIGSDAGAQFGRRPQQPRTGTPALPGLFRTIPKPPPAPPAEPTTAEYAQEKVDAAKALAQTRAVAALAKTGDLAAYEAALDRSRVAVNKLVGAELERLRTAGVQETALADLASMYDADTSALRKSSSEKERLSRQAAQATEADQRAVREAIERNATAADKQVEQLREWAAAAERLGNTGLAEQLRAEAREVEVFGATTKELAKDFVAAGAEAPKMANAFRAALDGVAPDLERATQAYEEAIAGLREQRVRAPELLSEEEAKEQATNAAEAFNAEILRVLDRLREQGVAPQIIAEIQATLKLDAEQPKRSLADVASTLEGVTRGILGTADAFGVVGERAKRALDGVINVFSGVQSALSGDLVGGITQAIGGIVGAIKGILGSGQAEEFKRLQRESQQRMRELVTALDRLRESARADLSKATVAQDISTVFVANQFAAQNAERIRKSGAPGGAQSRAILADLARTLGVSKATGQEEARADLERFLATLDERYGTGGQLQAFAAAQDEAGLLKALRELGVRLEDIDLASFGSDLQGRLDALAFAMQNAGDRMGDATERVMAFVRAAGEFSPQFAAELQRALAEGGPEAAEAYLQALAERFAQPGGLSNVAGTFGRDVSAAEVQRLIQDALQYVRGAVAPEAAGLADAGSVVEQTLARIRFELYALGTTDAVERIRTTIQALRDAGVSFGEFADELAALDVLDLATPTGQARQGELIAGIVERLRDPGADLGGLEITELRGLLLDYARARPDAVDDDSVTQSYQVQRGVTETTMRREIGLLTTISYWVEQSARFLARMLGVEESLPDRPTFEPSPEVEQATAAATDAQNRLAAVVAQLEAQIARSGTPVASVPPSRIPQPLDTTPSVPVGTEGYRVEAQAPAPPPGPVDVTPWMFADLPRLMAEAMGDVFAVALGTPILPPTPAQLGLGPQTQQIDIRIEGGPITIPVQSIERVSEAEIQRLAAAVRTTVGAEQAQQIDRALAQLTIQAERARGINTARR